MIPAECVSLTVSDDGENYKVVLTKSPVLVKHTIREQKLIFNFLKGDAILSRKLEKGDSLTKVFDVLSQSDDKIIDLIRPFVLPLKIIDTLYSYQRQGVAWLLKHNRAILADDMGLGKTYQAISAVRRLVRFGKLNWSLIVVPNSLLNNWFEEFNKWAPELKVVRVRRIDLTPGRSWLPFINGNHIVITSYESLRGDIKNFIESPPDLIIADEAHRLRKRDSLTFQSFRTIPSKYLWALTGTPIERSSEDLVVIMSLIEPRQFSMNDSSVHNASLQARARPYFLRRTKDQVLSELPSVIERLEAIELSEGQRKSYEMILRSKSFDNHLVQFNKLREVCDYDSISGESSKIERILEIVEDIASAHEKVVIFSYTLNPLNILAKKLEASKIDFLLLVGEQPIETRSTVLKDFKEKTKFVVLLASTKVSSEGITLTEANNVIFLNKWWNPSSNSQARDRVVRIGQKKAVQVISFKAKRTLEESLEVILSDKQKTYDQVLSALMINGISSSLNVE
jgi:SNF2 family DNA or RNA helicase